MSTDHPHPDLPHARPGFSPVPPARRAPAGVSVPTGRLGLVESGESAIGGVIADNDEMANQ